jgi:hypothetical protein
VADERGWASGRIGRDTGCAIPVGGLLPVPVIVTIAPCGDVRCTRIFVTLTADPTTRKRRRLALAAHAGSCTAAVSRAVFRYPDPWAVQTRGLAGRAGPSLGSSDGAPGVPFALPFAGLIPLDRWCARLRATGPACRSCRLIRPIIFRRVAAAQGCQIPLRRVGRG